jgi:hypothetical protein
MRTGKIATGCNNMDLSKSRWLQGLKVYGFALPGVKTFYSEGNYGQVRFVDCASKKVWIFFKKLGERSLKSP